MNNSALQGVFQGFDIAGAGLRAEMLRSEVVAANIANMNVTGGKGKEPYRRRTVVFEEALTQAQNELGGTRSLAGGVKVARVHEDTKTPFDTRHEPSNPLADEHGFILTSNVNLFHELVDVASIERSFQANLAALRAYRGMVQDAIANMRT